MKLSVKDFSSTCGHIYWSIFVQWKCFFLFHFKSSFCSKDILNNCTNFFGHAEKRFDKEAKINFKSFDAIN